MAKPIHEMSTWGHSRHHSRLPEEEWQVTREMTQIMRNREDYLENDNRDIGRRISDDTHELFVVCDPAEAMVQQFKHLQPELIAVHDIASDSSRRLLAGLAAATGRKVQKLLIRRQGFGMPLATLEFAELPGPGGKTLRVYTTIADADTVQRQQLAVALMAHARLAVVIAGDLPPHALATALEPLREGMAQSSWLNRNMLLVPLGGSSALANAAPQLAGRSGVIVRVTPQAMKPGDAWGYVSLAWDRLRETGSVAPPATRAYGSSDQSVAFTPITLAQEAPTAPPATVAPLPMRPMPTVSRGPAPSAASATSESSWTRFARDCADIKGVVSCAVVDLAAQRSLAHAGSRPGPAALCSHGGALWTAMLDCARQLGLAAGPMEASLSLAGHHLVLRAIAGHPGLALFVVLDRSAANLMVAQLALQRLTPDAAPVSQH